MADRIYYVIRDDNCMTEGMTKEQIYTAIASATGNTPTDVDSAFISKIKELRASNTVQIWTGTEAQFNALLPTPSVHKSVIRIGTNGVLYICTDDTTIGNVPSHAETHKVGGSDALKASDIGAQTARQTFTNKTVATASWLSNSTYADFPYRASVACSGVTASMFAEVVFSPADAMSSNYAPVCQTYSGGVYLYAKEIPSDTLTIPTIVVWG